MKGIVKFAEFTKTESESVSKILTRAAAMARNSAIPFDKMTLEMDLAATHAHTPLRLDDLLEADDFNFGHDIFGIMGHIDRTTGKLQDCFLPRFAGLPLT